MYRLSYSDDIRKIYGKQVRVSFYEEDPDPRQAYINGYDDYDPSIYQGVLQKIKMKKNKKNSWKTPTLIIFKQINKKIQEYINPDTGFPDKFRKLEICNNYVFCVDFDRVKSVEVKIKGQYQYIYKND